MNKFPNFRNIEIVKLITVAVCEGEGTQNSPSRIVKYYLDFEGNLVFKEDISEITSKHD